jgi:hypothetical protein
MKLASSVGIAALALACAPAQAWHDKGHMEVAAVAWTKLTPVARAEVARLLTFNPLYHSWVVDAPEAERDETAFLKAAIWPDTIKSMHGYHNDGPDHGDRPPPGPDASRNIGYADHLRHKYWHFIDLPFSPDGTPTRDPDKPNAQTQIATFRATLADRHATDDVRSYDLVWLLHLVGDVHQPLHATSRFTATQTDGDAGGNHVVIDCGCSASELHAFWDGVVGESNDPQVAIKAAGGLPAANPALASIADEKLWIEESLDLAKKQVYVAPVGVGDGPFSLDPTYKANALKVAKDRIATAGARLGNLLNEALK